MKKAINRRKKGTHAHKDQTFLDEQSHKSNARDTYMKIHTYATKKKTVRNTMLTKLNKKVTTLAIESNTKVTSTIIERN